MRREVFALSPVVFALAACGGASPQAVHPAAPSTVAAAPCPTPPPAPQGRLRFRVTLDAPGASAVSGRLLVAMSAVPDVENPFWIGFDHMRDQWLAAEEIRGLAKGASVEVDPDVISWPKPFSQAPSGKYKVAAMLMREGKPVLKGPVVEQTFDGVNGGTVELRLDAPTETHALPADTDTIKAVQVESKLLSAFYGRPMTMEALVVLPPSYATEKAKHFVTEYSIPGFGGWLTNVYEGVDRGAKARVEAHYPEMVRVILQGMIPSGHHVFADSVNDGPWGTALVTELIPALEKQFRLVAAPKARFLNGHSSGGWSSLWLQITHPDFFGGTWSTAPDPVDFRNFTTVDVTPGSTDNFYRTKNSQPRMLMRMGGQDVIGMQEFARMEEVEGSVSALGTFDWVFSPRGPLGEPMHLFDHATGEQDPAVQKAWEKWDIHKVLDANWATLGPKLQGKIHVFAGDQDTFHLNESLALLCDFFKQKKSDAVCEMIPGKTHFDLTGDPKDEKSLTWRIEHEMAQTAGIK